MVILAIDQFTDLKLNFLHSSGQKLILKWTKPYVYFSKKPFQNRGGEDLTE